MSLYFMFSYLLFAEFSIPLLFFFVQQTQAEHMITSPSSTTSKPNRTPKAAVGIVMLVEVRSLHSLSTVVSVCIS